MKSERNTAECTRPMVLAYVGSVVPDTADFRTAAFSRAGNIFQVRLLESIIAAGVEVDAIYSFLPIPSGAYSGRLFVPASRGEISPGIVCKMLPFINLPVLKQLLLAAMYFVTLLGWSFRRWRKARIIYVYNLTMPPVGCLWLAARISGAKLVASVNDINVPGQTVPSTIYYRSDYWSHRFWMRRLDGVVAVTDKIVQDFCPAVPSIIMEGGVLADSGGGPSAPKSASKSGAVFQMVLAGFLHEYNGVSLTLAAMRLNRDSRLRLLVAGDGPLRGDVLKASMEDERISYMGFLDLPALHLLYSQSDLLLNIRVTQAIHTEYFFPSKLLEYLSTGVPVLSTKCSHVEREYADRLFVLRDETPEALAEELTSLLETSNEQRARVGAKAKEFVQEQKGWNRQGLRIAELLVSVAAKS